MSRGLPAVQYRRNAGGNAFRSTFRFRAVGRGSSLDRVSLPLSAAALFGVARAAFGVPYVAFGVPRFALGVARSAFGVVCGGKTPGSSRPRPLCTTPNTMRPTPNREWEHQMGDGHTRWGMGTPNRGRATPNGTGPQAGCAHGSYAAGRASSMVRLPFSTRAPTVPPMAAARRATMARPRPLPWPERAVSAL